MKYFLFTKKAHGAKNKQQCCDLREKIATAAASCAAGHLLWSPSGVVESEASERLHILRHQILTLTVKLSKNLGNVGNGMKRKGFGSSCKAWPAYQPDPDDIDMLLVKLADSGHADGKDNIVKPNRSHCKEATFNLATALVFNNLDVSKGLQLCRTLADEGDNPGMCAYAVVHLGIWG